MKYYDSQRSEFLIVLFYRLDRDFLAFWHGWIEATVSRLEIKFKQVYKCSILKKSSNLEFFSILVTLQPQTVKYLTGFYVTNLHKVAHTS